MSSLSDLLAQVEQAFVEGAARPRPQTSGRWYSELLQYSINHRISPEEWAFFHSVANKRDKALQAAREDRLEQARTGFDATWARLRQAKLSQAGQLLVQAFLEPAEAYLYYKLHDYAAARELVLHASALDQMLIATYGFEVLSLHRVHLGHNYLRIHTRLDEREEAIRLAAAYLDYLELEVDALPDLLASPRTLLECIPEPILALYFDKFCSEAARVLAGRYEPDIVALFQPLAHHAHPHGCRDAGFAVQAHAWLCCKQMALNGDIEAFLATAAELLRYGQASEPGLWFAAIDEVVAFGPSLGPQGVATANRIASAAVQLRVNKPSGSVPIDPVASHQVG